jgi:uncharacterized protein YjiS (DUF1127 family)
MSATVLHSRPSGRLAASLLDEGRVGLAKPLVWLQRIRDRRALAALHPEQIHDAGLDPVALRAESLKPFWRD